MVWLGLAIAHHGALLLSGGNALTLDILHSLKDLNGGLSGSVLVLGDEDQSQPFVSDLTKFGFSNVSTRPDADAIDQAKILVVPNSNPKRWMSHFGKNALSYVDFIEHGGTWCAFGASATLAGESAFEGEEKIPGLALFDGIVQVDYLKKHREIPLRNAYFQTRVQLGIGLDADEWLVLRDNVIEKKVGQPQVFLREAG